MKKPRRIATIFSGFPALPSLPAFAAIFLFALAVPGGPANSGWLDAAKGLIGGTGQTSGETSGQTASDALSNLDLGDITAGLLQALEVATGRVSDQLGTVDGFNADPAIHIPLPSNLQGAASTLAGLGFGSFGEDLELRLNRAAEAAMPQAKQSFLNAISAMTLDDARAIFNGPDDAATQYFRRTLSSDLTSAMGPIIDNSLSQVGALQAYDAFVSKYDVASAANTANQTLGAISGSLGGLGSGISVPQAPDLKADLKSYVTGLALDGIFSYLAVEEAAIRKDPVKRSTELLQKVFGAAGL